KRNRLCAELVGDGFHRRDSGRGSEAAVGDRDQGGAKRGRQALHRGGGQVRPEIIAARPERTNESGGLKNVAVLKQTKASTKLVGTRGAALAAFCIRGAMAACGIREMQGLGQTLYRESSANSEVRTIVEVDLARAIAEVHSAPAELDLGKLKDKRKNVQSIL